MTELLLRLEKEVIVEDGEGMPSNRNLLLVTGHSFGGAVVLAALSEVMLERVASGDVEAGDRRCLETRPFGHGVVLLNPAVEANEALPLKELVTENCFVDRQVRLMHVISSDADKATNKAFRAGQFIGVNLTWKQADLQRTYEGKNVVLPETELDTITVGNFKPFQTGQLSRASAGPDQWKYTTCVGEDASCLNDEADRAQHIPARSHEPLAFIHTDGEFIKDHNDVFNNNVSAYLAAVMGEARYKLSLRRDTEDPCLPTQCRSDKFGPCFDFYQKVFHQLDEARNGLATRRSDATRWPTKQAQQIQNRDGASFRSVVRLWRIATPRTCSRSSIIWSSARLG